MNTFKKHFKQKTHKMKHLAKTIIIAFSILGILFFVMIALAFTSAPFYMHFRLGQSPNDNDVISHPKQVVMFGGAGMPSEDNLMRLYHTAALARHYEVPVLLVHPEDSLCQAEMARLLRQGGIDSVLYMTEGANTRTQALGLIAHYPELSKEQFIVVTSPEHVRRTVKCLNKVGFNNVIGKAAYPATVDFDLSLKTQRLEGNEAIPSVESVKMRYTFFNYLKLEIICLREYFALGYYKIKGWI